MTRTLHIVNGDSTASLLEQSGIKGTIVVWREMLCEGPITPQVGTDEFWKQRYAFFETNFGVDKLEYYDRTISELLRVDDFNGDTDITLWFEYDLFCQINLLALMVFILERYRKDNAYYLICPAIPKPKLLSEYKPDQIAALFEERIKLTRNDLLFAVEAWEAFCTIEPDHRPKFDFGSNRKFNLLEAAMEQHCKRFPDASGLSQIDWKILRLLEDKPRNKEEIVNELLSWQHRETVYGFGDLQYLWYIDRLHHLIQSDNDLLSLTLEATELLHYGN